MVIVASASSTVLSQTVEKPRFYMWGDPPSGAVEHHLHIVPNVTLNTYDGWQDPDDGQWYKPYARPDKAAKAIVLKIIAYRSGASPWLPSGTPINIMLKDWGADSGNCGGSPPNCVCDSPRGEPEPDYRDRLDRPPPYNREPFKTRYFLPEDRLIPDMEAEWDPNHPNRFPLLRDADNADARTARSYRHPFLRNAGHPVGQGIPRPLREWTVEFVAAYRALQTLYANTATPIPDPSSFYFDTEAGRHHSAENFAP